MNAEHIGILAGFLYPHVNHINDRARKSVELAIEIQKHAVRLTKWENGICEHDNTVPSTECGCGT